VSEADRCDHTERSQAPSRPRSSAKSNAGKLCTTHDSGNSVIANSYQVGTVIGSAIDTEHAL
jgi:hypothetical protein